MLSSIKINASFFIHLALFILFSLGMVVPKGYSIGTVLLLLVALYIVIRYGRVINFKAERVLILALLIYLVVSLMVNLLAGHSGRDYELDARVLLSIPIVYALIHSGFNRTCLMLTFGLGGIAMGLDSIYEYYVLNTARVGLYPIRYGYIAAWLAIISLMSLVFFAKSNRISVSVILLLGVVGGVVASVLSGTRGSWLFLVVACALLTIYLFIYAFKKVRTVMVIIFTMGVVGLTVLGMTDNPLSNRVRLAVTEVKNYQANHEGAYTSIGMRFELWRLSAQIIKENPATGIGTDAFRQRIVQFVDAGDAQPYMKTLKHTHNDVIDKAVKTGVLSTLMMVLCLYLWPLVLFLKRFAHPNVEVHYYALSGTMLIIAWVIFGLTDLFLLTNVGAQYYLVSLAIFWAGLRRLKKA